jgi:hypothetical protein
VQAKFENKPEDQANKPKPRPVGKKKQKKKKRVNQEEELSWVEWETRRHVIIKHMFSPEEAVVRPRLFARALQLHHGLPSADTRYDRQGDDEFYPDLKADVREEVEKFGEVEVLTVFEVHLYPPLSACRLLYLSV